MKRVHSYVCPACGFVTVFALDVDKVAPFVRGCSRCGANVAQHAPDSKPRLVADDEP